jgi:serine/threonine protein kinase
MSTESSPTAIPRRYGRFELVAELSDATPSAVARQPLGGTLKPKLYGLLRVDHGAVPAADTVLADARRALVLDGPGIARLVDAGRAGGEIYVAFEHAAGETLASLRDLAGEDGVPPAIAVRVAVDALAALAKSHAHVPRPFTHGAVSARAILVGADGVTRVLGIGFGAAFTSGAPVTTTPEADVRGVAAALWETFAGRALADGEAPGKLDQAVGGAVSDALFEALEQALAAGAKPKAKDLGTAISDAAGAMAAPADVASYVERLAGARLAARKAVVDEALRALSGKPAPESRAPLTSAIFEDDWAVPAEKPGAAGAATSAGAPRPGAPKPPTPQAKAATPAKPAPIAPKPIAPTVAASPKPTATAPKPPPKPPVPKPAPASPPPADPDAAPTLTDVSSPVAAPEAQHQPEPAAAASKAPMQPPPHAPVERERTPPRAPMPSSSGQHDLSSLENEPTPPPMKRSWAVDRIGPGSTLGRYDILMPVARGGMAAVWAARLHGTHGFQKIVALKTMLPDVSDDPEFETMFLDEARVAARIRHPNVVEISDLGDEGEVLYLVMEWVEGGTVGALLRGAKPLGGIPFPVLLRLASQICAGLHAAHELRDDDGNLVDLVHRDMSPGNVLVSMSGFVKIVDFGIAKSKARVHMTKGGGGMVKGKTPYLSPEQLEDSAVDRRSDIFSLGALLYTMATGLHPFRADTEHATVRNIALKDPIPPRDIAPLIPLELEKIILTALQKKPKKRYQTAADLQRAIDTVAATIGDPLTDGDVAAFVRRAIGDVQAKRAAELKAAIAAADAVDRTGRLAALTLANGRPPSPSQPSFTPGSKPKTPVTITPAEPTPLAETPAAPATIEVVAPMIAPMPIVAVAPASDAVDVEIELAPETPAVAPPQAPAPPPAPTRATKLGLAPAPTPLDVAVFAAPPVPPPPPQAPFAPAPLAAQPRPAAEIEDAPTSARGVSTMPPPDAAASQRRTRAQLAVGVTVGALTLGLGGAALIGRGGPPAPSRTGSTSVASARPASDATSAAPAASTLSATTAPPAASAAPADSASDAPGASASASAAAPPTAGTPPGTSPTPTSGPVLGGPLGPKPKPGTGTPKKKYDPTGI